MAKIRLCWKPVTACTNWNYTRAMSGCKNPAEELNLNEDLYGENTLFPVNALTLGLNYDLFYIGKIRIAAGGQLSAYHANNRLDNLYGKNPFAGEVFFKDLSGFDEDEISWPNRDASFTA